MSAENLPKKPILKSTTTQAVAVGTGGTLGILAALFNILRAADVLPWGPDQDSLIIGILTTVFGPLISRLIAKILKKRRNGSLPNAAISLLLCAAILSGGCITIRTIDETGRETTTTRADIEAITACVQLIATNAPEALELASQIQDLLAKPESANRRDRRAELLERARVLLELYAANTAKAG